MDGPETFTFAPIGVIRTPYKENAPYQPIEHDEGEFVIHVDPRYRDGLDALETFRYLYVLYAIHRLAREPDMDVVPPWAGGKKIGLFASRAPARPNPIGLSVVRLLEIRDNRVYTSGMDVFDGTPLLDLKPYLKDLDAKTDANHGWVEDLEDRDHLMLHIKGIPHDA